MTATNPATNPPREPLRPGATAPDFELATTKGGTVRLSDFRGKKVVVLYFYPKDNTAGCTVESCTFRDAYEDFTAAGAEVVGVSADSVDSHEGFASRFRLPFVLASDPGGAVARSYGVTRGLISAGRVTFVIDREGVVRDAFSSLIRVHTHVTRALALVKKLAT